MKCPNCNKIIKKTDEICHFCNKKVKPNEIVKTQVIYQVMESPLNKWLILSIVILSFITLLETSLGVWYFFFREDVSNHVPIIKVLESPIKKYNIDETFEFDNLEITIKKDYIITILENKFSTYNGKEVIVIPVIIKNISDVDNSLNLYHYAIYGPDDNELDEPAAYFDNALFYENDLKPNESHIKYIYVLYDKDGKYKIKFMNNETQIVVKYNIVKDYVIDNIENNI